MANLIVKPTSGGSLILQDEGGDAALTVGATGVSTIVNANITAGTFPNGHIIQVVQGVKYNKSTTNSTSPVNSDLTVTITPAHTTNKVLLIVSLNVGMQGGSDRAHFDVLGTTTQSVGNATTGHEVGGTWCPRSADSNWSQGSVHWSILDAPATTSAKTYTVRFWGTGGYTVLNSSYSNDANSGNSMSSITAMEVVA